MPSAGWYPDPLRRAQWRYFDGSQWSHHVASNGRQGYDWIAAPQPTAGAARPAPGRSKWVLVGVVSALGLAGVASAVATGAPRHPSGSTTAAPTHVATTVRHEPTPSTSSVPPTTDVATAKPTPATTSTTKPAATTTTQAAVVPVPATTVPVVTAAPPATEAKITAATPPPSDQCDPNYEGACVPIASDVDCAGGSGNGPAYVRGPVRVVGRDIYGLDRDKDGIGCE